MTLPRRPLRALVLAAAVACALALAGCSGPSGTDTAPDGGGGGGAKATGWSYQDATGTTIRLDRRPERVVALDDVAISMVRYGLHPVGTFGRLPLAADSRWDGLDTDGIADIGSASTTDGDGDGSDGVDVDRVAALHPDLIITTIAPVDAAGTLPSGHVGTGIADTEQQRELAEIAPVAEVRWGGDGAEVVRDVTDLARSLGAEQSVVDAAETEFDDAASALESATRDHDVRLTALYADHDGVYVARPEDVPALQLLASHGADLTVPGPKGYAWGVYSWPNAGKVRGDVLLLSDQGYQADDLVEQPTFADQPALVAGQVHPWTSPVLDYASQAAAMRQLATWITESEPLDR
ncbi:ABC transporter substrate-binding protein [Curtobacterium luteum]|uniref:ABC transporter substrate-binding protein n=1 Tax=Curtobacterium luteum TaxID=33881 RepID=UPI000B0DF4D8|nr:ABC transporter substrate-binding protein [Curtobacterium luteum]